MKWWIKSAVVTAAAALISSPVFAQAKVEATLATVNAATFLMPRMEQLFADKVREKSNGEIQIKVVTDGQLGGIQENIEAVMAGNLEFAQINNANLGSFHSRTMLFDLPFVFRDNDHMRRVVRGDIGKGVYKEFEEKTGATLLISGLADGPRSVWNSIRPVNKPSDMQGLKLRVMQAPILIDTFATLGAIPTPMAYPEVYMAAKQGVIDGADTPPAGLMDMKAPEVAKYYSLTRHVAMPSGVIVNTAWFNNLSDAHKLVVQEAAAEAADWYDKTYDQDAVTSLDWAKAQGMEVNEPTDIQAFQDAMKGVYDKFADRVGGIEAIKAVQEAE